MSSPEEIQQQIESTRESLSSDVNRLADKVSPSAVVGRRVERVKGSANSLRQKVMGALPDSGQVRSAGGGVQQSAAGSLQSAAGGLQSAAGSVTDAASNAPQMLRQQAQGSPLAAGLVAFGVGMLVSALIPSSQAEQDLAAKAEETAKQKAAELREPLQQRAQEVAGQLKESAQQSAQQVKQTATEAASQTAEQARSSAQDVKQPLQG